MPLKGLSMEKWMCWSALGAAGGVFLLCLLDVFTKFPFGGSPTFLVVDILAMIACGLVAYVSWEALRDQR
jgi:hypothetical protein